jgi:hypothetical protein
MDGLLEQPTEQSMIISLFYTEEEEGFLLAVGT